eukprot:TRINITY_DN11171_c0_g1_i1.p1 TRINITY_DN11171_c0_g1~~TRINITY_DN11171_c0_g1_i1.p1  ORF type:complete len:299 (+),score=37.99 TRINITY_DN11171_c0_g1_i1:65-961(+)
MASAPHANRSIAMESFAVGAMYISTSAGLITFNKYMMSKDRFPHAVQLTMIHMATTSALSFLLYAVAPGLYPSMEKAKSEWRTLLKYIAPLGMLFALSLYASNQAYAYCSVAFLQFCKEGNIVLVFVMSCCLGLQKFSWTKTAVLSVVLVGCSFCAHGEINFVLIGFGIQIFSQVCECSKNLIGEVVTTGAGMKLDVLTFVLFQAPCSLLPLLVAGVASWHPAVGKDLLETWPLLLANASVAFLLNICIALTIKRLSTLAFVIIGLMKDTVIVCASAIIFQEVKTSSLPRWMSRLKTD